VRLASLLNRLVAITPQPSMLLPVLVTLVIEQRSPTIASPTVTPQAPKVIFRSLTNPDLGWINGNSNPSPPTNHSPTGFRLGPKPLSKFEAQNILARPRDGGVSRDSLRPEILAFLLNRSAIQRDHRWVTSKTGSGSSSDAPIIRHASNSYFAAHHRATETERDWQQHRSGWFSCDDEEQTTLDDSPPIPTESPGQFWDEDYPDPEAMLAYNLTEACSACAEERRRRRRDHGRIRELGILLSLGSEVRQWEERLAWENAFWDNNPMELDHIDVEDTASCRRSKSLPATLASGGSSASSSSALTRPRRVGSSGGSDSDSSTSSSAKHQAVPPPISITPPCVASSLNTAPSRPSALKLSVTLDNLVTSDEDAAIEKVGEHTRQDEEMCSSSSAESSDASDSDDFWGKSSGSMSSSLDNETEHDGEKRFALRRGRARWSWRKSLQPAQQLQRQQQQQIVVDMGADYA